MRIIMCKINVRYLSLETHFHSFYPVGVGGDQGACDGDGGRGGGGEAEGSAVLFRKAVSLRLSADR